jgi:CRP-like cAMP-binding protein
MIRDCHRHQGAHNVVTKKDGLAKLKAVPMFESLSQKELANLFDHARTVEHTAGHEIVTEGTGGLGFHLILTGEARVIRGGRKIATLGPSDFFGEMSLIDDRPRSASIIAETPVETLVLASWDFKPMVKSNADLAWKLLVHATGRLRAEQSARDAALA